MKRFRNIDGITEVSRMDKLEDDVRHLKNTLNRLLEKMENKK